MNRRFVTFVLLGLLVLGAPLLGGRALAQGEGGVPEGHPLVGSWLILFPDAPLTPPSLYTFGADGTVVGDSDGGPRHGSWEATGDRTGAFTVVGLGEGPAGAVLGLVQLRGSIDVDEAGDAFTLAYYASAVAADGALLPEEGPFTAAGQRIIVQQPTAPGTPTLDEATPEAGTPAAATPENLEATPVSDVIATALATAFPEEATPAASQ